MTEGPSFSHLFDHVTDLARSRAFYVDLLGLDVLLEHDGYLRVGGRDEAHLRLTAAGPSVDVPPTDTDWGARHLWLRDPDGYRLSLTS